MATTNGHCTLNVSRRLGFEHLRLRFLGGSLDFCNFSNGTLLLQRSCKSILGNYNVVEVATMHKTNLSNLLIKKHTVLTQENN
jgi:hypothetical protein